MNAHDKKPSFVSGSFRDPRARVFIGKNRVFRMLTENADQEFRQVRETGLLDDLIADGSLVSFKDADASESILPQDIKGISSWLEHDKLPYITYPYEWSFSGLKAAAMFHLDLQIRALEKGVKLNDASAYNVQFIGPKPIFIDHISFSPYQEGELWVAHRQFCDQFLNPLVLQSRIGIPFNDWYRGALEGLTTVDLAAMLPNSAYFSPGLLLNILLPAYFERRAAKSQKIEQLAQTQGTRATLPRAAFERMLRSLRNLIDGLSPRDDDSLWSRYTEENTYDNEEVREKTAFIAEFAQKTKPGLVWDIGCNTGQYSQVLLENGGGCSLGLEADPLALNQAFKRAVTENLNFLPLYQNITNPSPGQGRNGTERNKLKDRVSAEGMMALAIIHHLVIGSHVPMQDALVELVDMAPHGIIEFVPPSDPQVKRMLASRNDVTHEYSAELFDSVLAKVADVAKTRTLAASGRRLVWYSRLGA